MCKIKIQLPVIPEGATDNDRRQIMFDYLSSLDLSQMVERREQLTYLSWANCFSILKQVYPDATFRVVRNEDGLPYFTDPATGIMVFTEVAIDGIMTPCFLPVMDYRNQSMKPAPYTYQVWDRNKKAHTEKNVEAATMFDINKTIWRCLVKNVALATGIGLYLYQGEDVPGDEQNTAESRQSKPWHPQQPRTAQPQPASRPATGTLVESVKNAINSTADVPSLVSIYMANTELIEGSPELKTLLGNRKKALNSLDA